MLRLQDCKRVPHTEPEDRGKYFGMLGGAAGVGSLIGPALGGLLATINYRAPFLAGAFLLLLTLVWGYLERKTPQKLRE